MKLQIYVNISKKFLLVPQVRLLMLKLYFKGAGLLGPSIPIWGN
jgi:hypothetical protein